MLYILAVSVCPVRYIYILYIQVHMCTLSDGGQALSIESVSVGVELSLLVSVLV